jgi:hypothetical protein
MYSDPGMRGWKREVAWAGDRGGARWLMSLYPSRQDVFFALAATNAYVFAEDNNVYGFGDVVLERAFDGLVEIGQAGWFAIACSLLVRAATPRRLAGDLVAATIDDGRFDPRGLGGALGWLLGEGTGTPGRATAGLADVARVSRLHGAQILRLLWGLVPLLGPSRRGIHEPLELALQLATELGVIGDDNGVRAALGDLRANASPRSKVGTAARGLLDLPETANGAGIHEYAAAEAVVRWAESVDQAG